MDTKPIFKESYNAVEAEKGSEVQTEAQNERIWMYRGCPRRQGRAAIQQVATLGQWCSLKDTDVIHP